MNPTRLVSIFTKAVFLTLIRNKADSDRVGRLRCCPRLIRSTSSSCALLARNRSCRYRTVSRLSAGHRTFSLVTFCSITLPRFESAASFFSRAFSSSSCRRRFLLLGASRRICSSSGRTSAPQSRAFGILRIPVCPTPPVSTQGDLLLRAITLFHFVDSFI